MTYKCPMCGEVDRFTVHCEERNEVQCDIDCDGDIHDIDNISCEVFWYQDSQIDCNSCCHVGVVSDFDPDYPVEKPTPLDELQAKYDLLCRKVAHGCTDASCGDCDV